MNDFWANVVSKAVGRERKLPLPTIPQKAPEPAEPEPPADDDLGEYFAQRAKATGYLSVEERFGQPVEYRLPDGSKRSVAALDRSDITVRHTDQTWNTNSRQVQADRGLFGDKATPQERAAAHQLAVREGRYNTFGDDGGMFDSMNPWQRRQMVSDAIKSGVYNDAGHGDGGWFDATNPGRQ